MQDYESLVVMLEQKLVVGQAGCDDAISILSGGSLFYEGKLDPGRTLQPYCGCRTQSV